MVPEQGTVGSSGDLAPLAHLVLGLMGEGEMWSPKTGVGSAAEVFYLFDLVLHVTGHYKYNRENNEIPYS